MRWRDVRFEKPTASDADQWGQILKLFSDGSSCVEAYGGPVSFVAWMPLSELPKFDRVPDPPDGWRFVRKGEAFNSQKARIWFKGDWVAMPGVCYGEQATPIVPIDPPKPKYRPFANAAEFEPHRDRWLKGSSGTIKPAVYSDTHCHGMSWNILYADYTFEDGSPCGVEVTE